MKTSASVKLVLGAAMAAALALTPGAVFAQRGGGHAGGGFSGGFRGGFSGGARGSGGGSFRAPSRPAAPRTGSARPNSGFRPAPNTSFRPAGASTTVAPQTMRDGQWHAFGTPRVGTSGGFSAGTFVGGRTTFGANGVFRGFGTGFRGIPIGTRRLRVGVGFPRFRTRFFGGFGWGFGFGFGWSPCWSFGWAWDPFCYGAFAPWPYNGYDLYGYPAYDPYAYPPSVGYDPNYAPSSDQDYPPPSDATTPAPPPPPDSNWENGANVSNGVANSNVPVIVYLKDGGSFSPSDYWISDEQFHYVLSGREYVVPLSRVDLRLTNDVNHRNGATFWLKSAPDASPAPAALATPRLEK